MGQWVRSAGALTKGPCSHAVAGGAGQTMDAANKEHPGSHSQKTSLPQFNWCAAAHPPGPVSSARPAILFTAALRADRNLQAQATGFASLVYR